MPTPNAQYVLEEVANGILQFNADGSRTRKLSLWNNSNTSSGHADDVQIC